MNFLFLILMGNAAKTGIATVLSCWVFIFLGTFVAQAMPEPNPGDPTSVLIDFLVTKNSSTLGVTGVLGLFIYLQLKEKEKTQARNDMEKQQMRDDFAKENSRMREDYEKRISKLEAKSDEMERYIRKRKAGADPSEITTRISDLDLKSHG